MPREGVFARVLVPGEIKVGDEMTLEPRTAPRPWQAAVITLSDKGARGERVDESGPCHRQTAAGGRLRGGWNSCCWRTKPRRCVPS